MKFPVLSRFPRPAFRSLSRIPFRGILLCAISLAAAGTQHSGNAQDVPLITITKSDKVPLGFNGISGPDGAGLAQLIQQDLQLAGAFALGGPGTGNYFVAGTSNGSNLRGSLVERGGRSLLDRTYSGPARAQAHAFANDIVETLTGTRGIAGTRIAFVADQSGSKEVYLVDIDGSNLTQLTRDRSISGYPSISADRRRLLYTGYQSGYADVYEIDLGSGSRQRILKYPGTNSGAVHSPNGDQIAVTLSKDGNPELYTTDSGGGSPRRLTFTPGVESSPTWSPNGREIIYSSNTNGGPFLYRIPASGGSPSMVRTGHGYNTDPNWSPDGKRVVFTIREGGGFAVAVLELATGQTRVLTEGQRPYWAANSRHVVFADRTSLVLFDTLTSQRKTIVSGLGRISEPSCSR